MVLKINEILSKRILASTWEFILLSFCIENYGTLLLSSLGTNSQMINSSCIFFFFVLWRNAHKAKGVEERMKIKRHWFWEQEIDT